MRASSVVSVIFLLLIAVGHLLRVLSGSSITINSFRMPMWPSVAAFLFTAALAIWLWRDGKKTGV
jgi:hypothetical protein